MTLASSLVLLWASGRRLSEPPVRIRPGGHCGSAWIGRPDIRFALGLDGLSLWLFVLTSLLHAYRDRGVVGVDP